MYIFLFTESVNQNRLRLLNAEAASIYLKVSLVKKMRHLIRFSIALINLIFKPSAK